MSGSDRDRYAAAVGAFILACVVLLGTLYFTFNMGDISGRKDAEAQGYAAAYENDTAKEVAECWRKSDREAANECVTEAIKTGHDAQRSEADLAAQRKMSDWAFWSLIVAATSAFVTGIGTILLYQQIILTRQAVEGAGDATQEMKLANDLLKQAQRPWVFVNTVLVNPREWRKNSDSFEWSFNLDNKGTFPAIIDCISVRLCLTDGIPSEPPIEHVSPAQAALRYMSEPEIFSDGMVISAGEKSEVFTLHGKTIINRNEPLPPDIIERRNSLYMYSTSANPNGLRWWLQGYVTYHGVDGREHSTHFCLKCDSSFGKVTAEGGKNHNYFN